MSNIIVHKAAHADGSADMGEVIARGHECKRFDDREPLTCSDCGEVLSSKEIAASERAPNTRGFVCDRCTIPVDYR